MIVLHIANLTDARYKGPNLNVPKNIIYGNKYADVALYNLQNSELAIKIPKEKFFRKKDYKVIGDLPKPFDKPDIVVFQGVYYLKYCKIAEELKKKKIPYIIVPRCSMTTAGVKSHYLKKKLANKLLFNRFIAGAKSIQFLTKNEYLESKDNFKFKGYYVLGNGVEMPKMHYVVKSRKEFKIVFIGRYNIYHKGLDVLLESARRHVDWFKNNNVTLELYGSDSDNGLAYLSKYINKYKLKEIVHLKGHVFGERKEDAFLDADLFIHTSRLEGQPTAVIEAISYGVPVIVTPGTNVSDVVEANGLGFITELNSEAVFNCIKVAFSSKSEFLNISQNEINFANSCFNWDRVILSSLEQYSRLVGAAV